MKRAFIFAAGLVLLAACLVPATQNSSSPAPAFELKDLNGQALTLSQFKNKVVVLNFWATWCPPCRAEIPDFVETYNAYKDKGLVIIGVSLDQVSPQELVSFVNKYDMTYPVAFGTEKIMDDYQPGRYIPATIVIDKKGMIRSRHVGAMDEGSLKSLFLKLSAE
jgi:cytochrome c biogenesis protein CcmG/thiol:disulfide interchange protein DsbE